MKVPSASPAWAWGNWYQGNSYSIGAHDFADLDFATGLLADAAACTGDAVGVSSRLVPRRRRRRSASKRSIEHNARAERTAARRRAWHRELSGARYDLSPRLGSAVGELVVRVGCCAECRSPGITAIRSDTRIRRGDSRVWRAPCANARRSGRIDRLAAEPLSARHADQRRFLRAFAGMTRRDAARMQCARRDLHARRFCSGERARAAFYRRFFCPYCPRRIGLGRLTPAAVASSYSGLRRSHRLISDAYVGTRCSALRKAVGRDTIACRRRIVLLLLRQSIRLGRLRHIAPMNVRLAARTVQVAPFTCRLAEHASFPSAQLSTDAEPRAISSAGESTAVSRSRRHVDRERAPMIVVFAPFAGARMAELGDGHGNAATSIGLLRDAVDPAPPIIVARLYRAVHASVCRPGRSIAITSARELDCRQASVSHVRTTRPTFPVGGALFKRTLTLRRRQHRADRPRGVLHRTPRDQRRASKAFPVSPWPGRHAVTFRQWQCAGDSPRSAIDGYALASRRDRA